MVRFGLGVVDAEGARGAGGYAEDGGAFGTVLAVDHRCSSRSGVGRGRLTVSGAAGDGPGPGRACRFPSPARVSGVRLCAAHGWWSVSCRLPRVWCGRGSRTGRRVPVASTQGRRARAAPCCRGTWCAAPTSRVVRLRCTAGRSVPLSRRLPGLPGSGPAAGVAVEVRARHGIDLPGVVVVGPGARFLGRRPGRAGAPGGRVAAHNWPGAGPDTGPSGKHGRVARSFRSVGRSVGGRGGRLGPVPRGRPCLLRCPPGAPPPGRLGGRPARGAVSPAGRRRGRRGSLLRGRGRGELGASAAVRAWSRRALSGPARRARVSRRRAGPGGRWAVLRPDGGHPGGPRACGAGRGPGPPSPAKPVVVRRIWDGATTLASGQAICTRGDGASSREVPHGSAG